MKIVFMGTPDFAVPTLAALVYAGHRPVAVYTQPPKPAGRGMEMRKTPVHVFAEKEAIPVFVPPSLRSEEEEARFKALEADLAIVVAYGLILPKTILSAPKRGCLNLHASLLPRWRGAAPIQRAIMAGDTRTGNTVMRMDEGLDTGAMCLTSEVEITPDMTAGQLHDILAKDGAELVAEALRCIADGSLDCTPQPEEGVVYAAKITAEDGRIDWTRPAKAVQDQIRGLSPVPGAWFELGRGDRQERVKVLLSEPAEGAGAPGEVLDGSLTVACGEAAVRLLQVQRAGKKPMAADEFLRGLTLQPGTILG